MIEAINVRNNTGENRFEAEVPGGTAVLEYERHGSAITLTHTDVPKEAAGRGVGQALVTTALDFARQHELKVVPKCAYVKSFLQTHREFNDVLNPEYQVT
jgi:predicted GNAT family acetyltransferase